MDWQQNEIDQMLIELNPELAHAPVEVDANWHKLRLETASRTPSPAPVLKTKTPTIYDFGKDWYGFSYREHDGAHWHTVTCNLLENVKGLTPMQALLKDYLITVLNLSRMDIKPKWWTPVDDSGKIDPTYQLIRSGSEWWCVIGEAVYAQSTVRMIRNHEETRFNTRHTPIFTLDSLIATLDQYIRPVCNR